MESEAGGDAEQTAERNVWHYGRRKAIAARWRYVTTFTLQLVLFWWDNLMARCHLEDQRVQKESIM